MLAKCFGLLLVCALAGQAGEARVTSVVRPDAKSGRLVRSVVVSPKHLPARRVAAGPVEAPAKAPAKAPENLSTIIDSSARAHRVDPLLVHAVIEVESNYNPYAISPKGAEGLMQLMPPTARQYGVSNPFDARQNIEAGVRHLKYLQELFQDDRLALAAYNAGEGAVKKHRDVPPYPETEQYVYRVGKKWVEARKSTAANSEAETKSVTAEAPREPAPRGLETYTDSEGRVYLRTRPETAERNR